MTNDEMKAVILKLPIYNLSRPWQMSGSFTKSNQDEQNDPRRILFKN